PRRARPCPPAASATRSRAAHARAVDARDDRARAWTLRGQTSKQLERDAHEDRESGYGGERMDADAERRMGFPARVEAGEVEAREGGGDKAPQGGHQRRHGQALRPA